MDFNLEIDEINYVLSVLAQRPYQESANLIHKLQEQAKDQQDLVESQKG